MLAAGLSERSSRLSCTLVSRVAYKKNAELRICFLTFFSFDVLYKDVETNFERIPGVPTYRQAWRDADNVIVPCMHVTRRYYIYKKWLGDFTRTIISGMFHRSR